MLGPFKFWQLLSENASAHFTSTSRDFSSILVLCYSELQESAEVLIRTYNHIWSSILTYLGSHLFSRSGPWVIIGMCLMCGAGRLSQDAVSTNEGREVIWL